MSTGLSIPLRLLHDVIKRDEPLLNICLDNSLFSESGVRGMAGNCYDVPPCSVKRGNDRTCTFGNDSSNDSRSVTYNSKNAVSACRVDHDTLKE